MISGSHLTLFSADPEADRKFFKDVLKLPYCDPGGGWLLFDMPTTVGFHTPPPKAEPTSVVEKSACVTNGNGMRLLLSCDDVEVFVKNMKEEHQIECSEVKKEDWGILTSFKLPGGSPVEVYQSLIPVPEFTKQQTEDDNTKV